MRYARGLVADGKTDNHAAIQTQLTELSSTYGGGTLLIPPANKPYLVSADVKVPAATILQGASHGVNAGTAVPTVWTPASAVTGTMIGPTSGAVFTTGLIVLTGASSQVRTLTAAGVNVAPVSVMAYGKNTEVHNGFGWGGTTACFASATSTHGQSALFATSRADNRINTAAATTGLSFHIAAPDNRIVSCYGNNRGILITGADWSIEGGHYSCPTKTTLYTLKVNTSEGGKCVGVIFDGTNHCAGYLEVVNGLTLVSGCRFQNSSAFAVPVATVTQTVTVRNNLFLSGCQVVLTTSKFTHLIVFAATSHKAGAMVSGVSIDKTAITVAAAPTTTKALLYSGGTPSLSHGVVYAGTVQTAIG
ncbi:MAG: pectate lyase family protein [Acidimicrobiales bacterium]